MLLSAVRDYRLGFAEISWRDNRLTAECSPYLQSFVTVVKLFSRLFWTVKQTKVGFSKTGTRDMTDQKDVSSLRIRHRKDLLFSLCKKA